MKKKVILIIRDGWGYRHNHEENAIFEAPTPNTDELMAHYPHVLLNASGEAVGLPKGFQGNSEVGHTTIGSGRIMCQSLARIDKSIKNGSFFNIQEFLEAIDNCKRNKTTLHIIGLMQVEGVHSHINHLFALLKLCHIKDFKKVFIHVITDGRDAPVTDSLKHLNVLQEKLSRLGGKIASVSGRYYAMDRDNRWNRTKVAYEAIVQAKSVKTYRNPEKFIKASHKKGVTDEFIIPGCMKGYKGMQPKDSVIFYNFRTDRPRQLTKAIVESEFEGWDRKPLDVFYVGMTQYYKPMNAKTAFKDLTYDNLLGKVIADQGLHQLRISETEKYAHVTFFFNGQIEKPNHQENRILIPSPKVATYDLKPEMSAYEVTSKLVEEIQKEKYEFIVVNLVNGDMVGHTGKTDAIRKAVSTVDECVGRITKEGLEHDYNMLIFADHGNAEDQRLECRTSHTINPVPLIFVSHKHCELKSDKGLQDIAPTVLDILGIEKPDEMTGESILEK